MPRIRARVGTRRVLCALSGGVDSTVTAALVHRAIGDRLTCIFVDNGLLRAGEADQVMALFHERMALDVRRVEAAARFLQNLRDVEDPERKRRIIGVTFIEVFEEAGRTMPDATFLAQGTLYPDVIESTSVRGPSATIKSHHNVGGLPERMHLELVEPLRELFKDEVRELGRVLDVPMEIVGRQPFPGPGLAIRIIGPVDAGRLAVVRAADAIVQEEIRRADLRQRGGDPRRALGRRDDRRLGAPARRPARPPLDAHHQRGRGREPGRIRRLVEAACHHRVGVGAVLSCSCRPARTRRGPR